MNSKKLTAAQQPVQEPMEMRICELRHVILHRDRPYIFTVDPNCEACRDVAMTGNYAKPAPPSAPVQEGCGACGDGCAERGSCRVREESPPSAPVGVDSANLASALYDWMSENDTLAAEVVCDYAGMQNFKNALARKLSEALTQQPAQAAPGVDLEQFRPAVDALYAAGCTKVENGFTLNAKHYDACRLYDVLDKAKAATPPGDDAAGERRDDLDDQDDADLEAWLGDRS